MEPAEYAKLAAVEDAMWYFRALHTHIHDALAKRWRGQAARVLDAGCGTGGLIRRCAALEPAWQWTGVDVSPLAVEVARSRTTAEIREASVTALPFPEASFDAVVFADVLYHLDDDVAALREARRVLRPQGLLVVNVPAYPWLWSYHDEATHARRRYGRDELRQKLSAAGFCIERLTNWNALLLPLVAVRRKLLPAPAAGSDVQAFPPYLEALGRAAMATEKAWLKTGAPLPAGTSIFAEAAIRSV